jgi:hypothetical protein
MGPVAALAESSFARSLCGTTQTWPWRGPGTNHYAIRTVHSIRTAPVCRASLRAGSYVTLAGAGSSSAAKQEPLAAGAEATGLAREADVRGRMGERRRRALYTATRCVS